ncbi:cobaltochelatase subunit CobN, partial [Brevundimonas sp. GN22]
MIRLGRLCVVMGSLWLSLTGMATGNVYAGPRVKVTYVVSDSAVPAAVNALGDLTNERPDLKGRVQLKVISESSAQGVVAQDVLDSHVLVFDMMNEQMLGGIEAEAGTDIIAAVARNGTVLAVGEGLSPATTFEARGATVDTRASTYWAHAGASNHLGLLKLALGYAGVEGLTLPEPVRSMDFGYYYPSGRDGQVFADWSTFAASTQAALDKPRIAVGFFKANYYSGDMAVVDALVREIERQGGQAIPFFGYPGPVALQRLLTDGDGRPRADAAIAMNMQFADAGSDALVKSVGIPVINGITLYGRSEAEWRVSTMGLTSFEGTFNVAVPELAGAVAPTVIGSSEKRVDSETGQWMVSTHPIDERVRTAVERAMAHARLRRTNNADKRIALVYYNYPAGRANVGASYLNVAETVHNLLTSLKNEGYDIGGEVPDEHALLARMTEGARNVMGAAPGELEQLIATGDVIRIEREQYAGWLSKLPKALREKIVADWGAMADGGPMVAADGALIVPALRFGKVVLMPQPARGWGENLQALYHAKNLAPHHQYVAAYSWLKDDFGADAIVHIGTHGTLEWLDGKDVGLGPEDASDLLIGTMPHGYIYNVDVVGEGLVARRRSAAVLVDHMVPPFVAGELTDDLAKLSELVNDHSVNEGKNPELATLYARQARDQAIAMGLGKDLSLDPSAEWTDEDIHRLEDYILELKAQTIPYGMHAFGRTPSDEAIASTVGAVVGVDRQVSLGQEAIDAADIEARIRASGPRELQSLVDMLSGRYISGGVGGEPVRNPDAYSTGKNFYGLDPDKLPKPVAYQLGVRLAEEFLAGQRDRAGDYPRKVSFVIWGDETMRHEGVLESQIFHLLGTRPVWDARGKVVDVELISRAELGRPRVDIVIASAAEGMFANLTRLLDKAVQLAKDAEEPDNAVRINYLAMRDELVRKGVSADDANRMAAVRIFDEPPGQFNLNTSSIAAASGSWDDSSGMANDYIQKIGHAFGAGFWGEAMPEVFSMALAGTQAVIHSSSTTLYGALDNDDMYMYMGGLSVAIRSVTEGGQGPDLYITNTRDPDRPAMSDIHSFIGTEFRSRYVNPQWIRGMQSEGYAGAGAIREFVEYMWGWEATVSDTVDDAMWKETFQTYVQDKHDLGMKAYFESQSPYAYQDITARMIETIRKGAWAADTQTRQTLVEEYLSSIEAHGVNCTEVSCGNGRMVEYVLQSAAELGVARDRIDAVQQSFETAMGRTVAEAAAELRDFVAVNEGKVADVGRAGLQASVATPEASNPPATTTPAAASYGAKPTSGGSLEGFVMERSSPTMPKLPAPQVAQPVKLAWWDVVWPVVVILGGLCVPLVRCCQSNAKGA